MHRGHDARARRAQLVLHLHRLHHHEPGAGVYSLAGLHFDPHYEPGQRVDAGAGLVVVEAMKMENELRAAGAGVVAAVHVAPGQVVERGAALVTLESAEPSG